MDAYKGKTVIINAVTAWGETKYSIGMDGRAMVGTDKAKWEASVQQLRDAGAIIVDGRDEAARNSQPGGR